jgi:hypothetical protein
LLFNVMGPTHDGVKLGTNGFYRREADVATIVERRPYNRGGVGLVLGGCCEFPFAPPQPQLGRMSRWVKLTFS